ncbi:MAG: amino acid ABC transporter substrate-binding protein [Chloroflexi bacterium]|jgi:general L-amino acid transport system substrate-binding protein|nr:amino acid ABC transporter substrate-binding protein [Chloroflexota bacterium]
MLRKPLFVLISILILSMALAACSGAAPTAAGPTEEAAPPDTGATTTEAVGEAPGGEPEAQPPAASGQIVERVRSRGTLVCGSRTDLAGFGYLKDNRNVGFDVDLCRAVAAAVLGDPEAVEVVNLSAAERGPALQTGEVDILSRNTTWSTVRDAQWGNFTWIMFYDGQGFIVPADSGITSIEDMDGATICVTSGTTTELNLADAFRQRGLDFEPVTFEDTASVYGAYEEGRCDVATSDLSQLASVRSGFADPEAHVILDITISKEPLTPAVPSGDDVWFDIVKSVMFGLINAEEYGVTQANVEEMKNSDNVEVRRLLGTEGDWGQSDLGLDPDAMARVIAAVGNYGEIYDRYMGPNGDAFTLDRGLNRLWTEGGLIYAPPLR